MDIDRALVAKSTGNAVSVTDHNHLQRLVIAEDDPDDFFLFERALSKCELNVSLTWARNGEEALELLCGQGEAISKPSLIVSDLKMPRIDGFEFLKTIKANDSYRNVPFVILTASDHEADRLKAQEFGADLYLVKPIAFEPLVGIVKRLLLLAVGFEPTG